MPKTRPVTALTQYLSEHLTRADHVTGANYLIDVYQFAEHTSVESLAEYGRGLVLDHYFSRDDVIRWLRRFDLPKVAKLLQDRIPDAGTTVRTGDVAEMLAVDYAEKSLGLTVPIRKLRYRSARNVAMFGDDALGLEIIDGRLFILRVEAKNYSSFSLGDLQHIYDAMSSSNFLPTEDTLAFTAKLLNDETVRDLVEGLQARGDLETIDLSLMMFVVYENEHSASNVSSLPASRFLWPFLAAIGVCLPERKRVESLMYDLPLLIEDAKQHE